MKTKLTLAKIKALIILAALIAFSFEVSAMPGNAGGGGGCDVNNPAGTTNLCSNPCSPCGAACGFASNPTVDQVVDNCPAFDYNPALAACYQSTNCFTFTASATTVSFGVIISSTCTNGNVTYVNWSLYSNCSGAAIQTGTLSSLSFSGLTVGASYTFCYTFQVPSGCTHSTHYPYFVGATPLSNNEVVVKAENKNNKNVIKWSVFDNEDCSHYTVERKNEDSSWKEIAKISSNNSGSFTFEDDTYAFGNNYYKIKQYANSGNVFGSDIVVINNKARVKKSVGVYNIHGQKVAEDAKGFVIIIFEDGTVEKQYRGE
jgi:hypothetical protein